MAVCGTARLLGAAVAATLAGIAFSQTAPAVDGPSVAGDSSEHFTIKMFELSPATDWAEGGAGLLLPLPSQNADYPFGSSRWPAYGATHRTAKIAATISCHGIFGGWRRDPETGLRCPGFEFPVLSGNQFLNIGSVWIGGIVNGDTLVSAGYCYDLDSLSIPFTVTLNQELFPPNIMTIDASVTPMPSDLFTAYQATYVDTFTYDMLVDHINYAWMVYRHKPLGLSVRQRTYTCNRPPFQNVLLVDFVVTNVGSQTVRQAYLGLVLDPDLYNSDAASQALDDMAGSFRETGTVYIIDNDGDPSSGYFPYGKSVPDGLGARLAGFYPPARDTNFNWWTLNAMSDFGPRTKPTPDDPFRNFGHFGTGTPSGDRNRYYLLRHREWDLDQFRLTSIRPDDSVWLYPDRFWANVIAHGADVTFSLSAGPVDLPPDSSFRAVFALFGGETVHVDPFNGDNLAQGNFDQYYRNLFFDVFRRQAERSLDLADLVLDPINPPLGLEQLRMISDTAFVGWSPWVFPDVVGYKMHLIPVDDSLLIGPNVAIPVTGIDPAGGNNYSFPAGVTGAALTGFEPGRLYYGTLSHMTASGDGNPSRPVVIGSENRTFAMEPVKLDQQYLSFRESETSLDLSWQPSSNPLVTYYRVYRALDSAEALNRYRPFVSDDPASVPFSPRRCVSRNDTAYCYYEMAAYDSVPGDVHEYHDLHPVDGSWYWVSAVIRPGFESPFSTASRAEKVRPPARDIVVILGTTGSLHDYVNADSLTMYYQRLLEGYDYEIYNWSDTNLNQGRCPSGYCVHWQDLADFRLVIVEEYPQPKILAYRVESVHKLLTRLVDYRHDLAYFGTPPGADEFWLHNQENLIAYDTGWFESDYFNLDSSTIRSWSKSYNVPGSIDSLAGFNAALPADEHLPLIRYDTDNSRFQPFFEYLFQTDQCLPLTAALFPNRQAEVLYTYGSRYPQTSQFQGRPCGVRNRRDGTSIYTFSFHLWGMEQTGARRLVDYLMDNLATTVSDNPARTQPERFLLGQNYPNPFNGTTHVRFELPVASRVVLDIYNILGQKVRTLLSETKPAGVYTVEWDGTDQEGRAVSSGVYLYKLGASNWTLTKKMVLLK